MALRAMIPEQDSDSENANAAERSPRRKKRFTVITSTQVLPAPAPSDEQAPSASFRKNQAPLTAKFADPMASTAKVEIKNYRLKVQPQSIRCCVDLCWCVLGWTIC